MKVVENTDLVLPTCPKCGAEDSMEDVCGVCNYRTDPGCSLCGVSQETAKHCPDSVDCPMRRTAERRVRDALELIVHLHDLHGFTPTEALDEAKAALSGINNVLAAPSTEHRLSKTEEGVLRSPEDITRCGAKAHAVQGQSEPVYLCPSCGDVTNEPRCPQDTPRQSNSGLDI
jgi:hypothetical protein